jgi:hypothetical protein
MKIKCCGRSKKRKEGEYYMVLRDVAPHNVKDSLLKPYATTGENIKYMGDEMLNILSDTLRKDMLMVTTEKARRTGIKTSCGCTDTHHKPITVNIPGIGNCQYTGD